VVTGLMVPDRTVDRSRVAMAPDRPAVVQVRPGDSLWSLAAEALGPGATDAEIAVAWHSIHLANVGRIGTDPDLIFPGTVLQLPASVTAEHTSTTHRRETR
jgi:nucleoid-associated protein YgaU